MTDTAGNQNIAIATNGTSHVAQTLGPTDVCLLADKKTPAPFPNFIPSLGNVLDAPTNTFIQSQKVLVKGAKLGPTSNPGHAGVGKGVKSKTYRDVAEPAGWSRDVKMEGRNVVRTNDPTTQNKGNTSGKVVGSSLSVAADPKEELYKKHCTILEIQGACDHGRRLGPPPGSKPGTPASYLEILGGDSVKFKATRKNVATDPPSSPKCRLVKHTSWQATAVRMLGDGNGGSVPKVTTREKDRAEVFDVDGDLTLVSSIGVPLLDQSGTGIASKSSLEKVKVPIPGLGKGKGGGPATSVEVPWSQIVTTWRALLNPPIVTVNATACAGTLSAKLKLFPAGKYEFNFFNSSLEHRLERFRKIGEMLMDVGEVFGKHPHFEFLKDPHLSIGIEYKEVKETITEKAAEEAKKAAAASGKLAGGGGGGGGWGGASETSFKPIPHKVRNKAKPPAKTPVEVGRAWSVELSFDPFLSVEIDVTQPVVEFLPIIGAAASIVARFLEHYGISADFFLAIELEINPKGSVTWDEYGDVSGDLATEVKLTFKAGFELRLRSAYLKVYGYAEFTFELTEPEVRPGVLLGATLKCSVQLGVKGVGHCDILWGVSKDVDFDWRPSFMHWPKEESEGTKVNFVAAPGWFIPILVEPA